MPATVEDTGARRRVQPVLLRRAALGHLRCGRTAVAVAFASVSTPLVAPQPVVPLLKLPFVNHCVVPDGDEVSQDVEVAALAISEGVERLDCEGVLTSAVSSGTLPAGCVERNSDPLRHQTTRYRSSVPASGRTWTLMKPG